MGEWEVESGELFKRTFIVLSIRAGGFFLVMDREGRSRTSFPELSLFQYRRLIIGTLLFFDRRWIW